MQQQRYYNRDLKDLGKTSQGNELVGIQQSINLIRPTIGIVVLIITVWIYVLVSPTPVEYDNSPVAESEQLSEPTEVTPSESLSVEVVETSPPAQLTQELHTAGKHFQPLLEKDAQDWNKLKIKSGDALYIIFKKLGINGGDATLIAKTENSRQLTKLRPGKTLHLRTNHDGGVAEIVYEDTPLTWIHALRNGNEFTIIRYDLPLTRKQHKVAAYVNSSLYAAGQRAGISDTQIMYLTEIFGWDIDFSLNVQAGDGFKLIYDDIYVDDVKKASGNILAAEFINNGKVYRAIAYHDESGQIKYYAPDGTGMQKTFLRSPVKFSRISSRFTKARYHPVLKKWRSHKGVDYAASRGTPVRATADGRISHLGRKGGYGKAVILNNGSTYSTLYGHLSSYSRGLKRGSRVKQGQIIGKVGSTGLATGPHLHYEFRINGKHVNPLTFRQPKSAPIPDSQKVDFLKASQNMEQELDAIEFLQVASGSSSDNG